MKDISEKELIQRAQSNTDKDLKEQLAIARRELAKATKECEAVKAKLYAVISGQSSLPEDILSEMAEESKQRMIDAGERVSRLQAELAEEAHKEDGIRKDYHRLLKWSELFDSSDIAVKKMVASNIIKRIYVYSDYQLRIEFNINLEQFELGLDIPVQHEMQSTTA